MHPPTQSVNLSHGPSREQAVEVSEFSTEMHQSKATQDASVKRQMGEVHNVRGILLLKPESGDSLSICFSFILSVVPHNHAHMQMREREEGSDTCAHLHAPLP